MAGISAVSMLSYMTYNGSGERLTAATKARLMALGVSTRNIRTESEGLSRLRNAEAAKSKDSNKNISKDIGNNDSIMQKIKYLANKIGLRINENDSMDNLIYQLKTRISELKSQAGDKQDKLKTIDSYLYDLEEIQMMNNSEINLRSTMNLTANMNVAFHSLY